MSGNKLTLAESQRLHAAVEIDRLKHSHLRIGQSLFNNLVELHPEWDTLIRGSKNDPFYSDKLIPEFLEEILDKEALAYWYTDEL